MIRKPRRRMTRATIARRRRVTRYGRVVIPAQSRSPIRWPLFTAGLACMGLYGALTIAAARYQYFPFDVPVERCIQSITWGPLAPLSTPLAATEGLRHPLLPLA